MLLKMIYQKDHHKISNDRVESTFTLANFSSYYYSSSTSVLIANVYLTYIGARHCTKCSTCFILFNPSIKSMYFCSPYFTNEVLEMCREWVTYPVL